MKKIERIHWLSNAPWSSTGYANQTRLFVPKLQEAGYNMSMTAFYGLEGGILNWDKVRVYPRCNHPYGQDIAAANSAHANADILISLMDSWVCDPRALSNNNQRWVPWFPVDMEPLPPIIKSRVSQAFDRIVYSKFGEKMVNDAGLDCHYVPHGVDTSVFRPMDKQEARRALGLPNDRFIIGMVAANKGNPSRKAFCEQIEAFAQFHSHCKDTLLYLHTSKSENGENQGVNLPEFISYHKISDSVIFPDQYALTLGFPEQHLVNLYNAFDVLLSVSLGEGFGIPILEAQACGCPVIVGDWTSMGELCFCGNKISVHDANQVWTPLAAYQYRAYIWAIAEALEDLYNGTMEGTPEIARKKSLNYDATKVTEMYWKPVLEAIGNRINA